MTSINNCNICKDISKNKSQNSDHIHLNTPVVQAYERAEES